MKRYYLQLALRGLLRHRTQTLLIIVTMAIGIASCMTAYTILNALMADPIAHGSRHLYLVSMDSQPLPKPGDHGDSSWPTLLKLRDAQALVDARKAVRQAYLAIADVNASTITGGAHDSSVLTWLTSAQAIAMFGIPLRHGRTWTAAESVARAPVAVIDEHLSRKLFGVADGVGRSLRLNGHVFRVIGVMANWRYRRQFFDLEQLYFPPGTQFPILLPAQSALAASIGPVHPGICEHSSHAYAFGSSKVGDCYWLETWVQLDTPQQVKSYRRYLLDYATAQHAAGRFPRAPEIALHGMNGWVAQNNGVPSSAHINLWLSLAFLALCMVNVTGLLLARFLRGSHEVAVRRTLGATRASVFAQHLIEAGGVSLLGGVLAVPLTLFGLWLVRQQQIGYASVAHLNLPMFITLFAVSVGVGLIVGVLPAWRASTLSPALQVKTN